MQRSYILSSQIGRICQECRRIGIKYSLGKRPMLRGETHDILVFNANIANEIPALDSDSCELVLADYPGEPLFRLSASLQLAHIIQPFPSVASARIDHPLSRDREARRDALS